MTIDLVKRTSGGPVAHLVTRARPVAHLVTRARENERVQRVAAVARAGTREAPRAVTRASWLTVLGHANWVRRAAQGVTHGVTREQVRLARIAGDRAALADWTERLTAEKDARAARMRNLPATALAVLTATATGVAVVLALLVVAGIGTQIAPGGADWSSWWTGVGAVLDTARAVLVALVVLAVWVAVPVLLFAAWREGRRVATPPRWLIAPADRDDGITVDERSISAALGHLGIPALNAFLKNGGHLTYVVGARRDGDGTYAQLRTPMGVTAELVAAQRPKVAANLGRATLETWLTTGDEAGLLDLWVADRGKLGSGAGEWPLLHDGEVDLFAGVPFGLSQRGQVIEAPLFESNWLIGGRPGQGKSAAMRTLLLGASLDPTCELWVFVMGESPDFKPFEPRLDRYAMGMDDSVAEAALGALRDALAEMERRGKVLGQQPGGPPKTSRKLADRPELGLHPLILAIDEVHELFMHPTLGKEACELAIRLIKRGRKYGVVLVLATQSPTKESIPREVTRNIACGVAFAVADHVANDGLLGAGRYKAGVRATDLRMKTDRGTCVAVGLTDAPFELVRCFYVPLEDGLDQVTPVIARAVANRRPPAVAAALDEEDAVLVDHLADISEVLRGEPRVRTQVVLGRLAERDPSTYERWTPGDLRGVLAEHGAEPSKSAGVMVVHAELVDRAIRDRGAE